MIHKLVVLRHGQSEWNKDSRFCGWIDISLSDKGRDEAKHAGELLVDNDLKPDIMYTSKLKRSIETGNIILTTMNRLWLDQVKIWRLNERHYGAYQGVNKHEVFESLNEDKEKFNYIRRNYRGLPPLTESAENDPCIDERYNGLPKDELPRGESLEMVMKRVVPFVEEEVINSQMMEKNKTVILVTHGSVVRSLIKHFTHISEDDIANVNIPTGIPLVFELDDHGNLHKPYYYLDKDLAEQGIEKVRNEGIK